MSVRYRHCAHERPHLKEAGMKGWRERAADIFTKHGEIAAKMKSAPRPVWYYIARRLDKAAIFGAARQLVKPSKGTQKTVLQRI